MRSSISVIQTRFVRYADSRNRWLLRSNEYSVVSNISGSATKLVVVPRRVPWGPIFLTAVFGLPRSYSWAQIDPSRADSTRIQDDSALTTLTPTPWRPPD